MNVNRKNTFFSSLSETKDVGKATEVRLDSRDPTLAGQAAPKLDKLLAVEEY